MIVCPQPPGGGLLMSLDDMSAAFWASEAGGELRKAVDAAERMDYTGPKVKRMCSVDAAGKPYLQLWLS